MKKNNVNESKEKQVTQLFKKAFERLPITTFLAFWYFVLVIVAYSYVFLLEVTTHVPSAIISAGIIYTYGILLFLLFMSAVFECIILPIFIYDREAC